MQELRSLDTSQLIDLLAKYTADYTKMMADNVINDEYEKYKLTIKALQTEIESRKNNLDTNPQTDFTTIPDFT